MILYLVTFDVSFFMSDDMAHWFARLTPLVIGQSQVRMRLNAPVRSLGKTLTKHRSAMIGSRN